MKKRLLSLMLVLILLVNAFPTNTYASHQIVMTADEFIGYLQYVVDRGDSKYGSGDQYSVGKYDGTYIYFDCWGLGESIICTNGNIVYNRDSSKNPWSLWDTGCGCGSYSGDWLKSQCQISSDFSNLVPGEWLFKDDSSGSCYHVGYYIGNGKVIESTSDGSYKTQISTIDSNGYCGLSGRSSSWKWTYHAKVPWIDYSSSTGDYLGKCTSYASYCSIKTTDSCPLWNMPCSDKTDTKATKITTISSGTTLTATALYKNTADNYWYKVTYSGNTGYVYAGNTSFVKQLTSDAKITGEESPSSLSVGQTFPIGGTVSTTYNKLVQVGGFIFKEGVQKTSGNRECGTFVNASTNSYSLKGSTIDNELTFNKLSAGAYYYMIQLCIRSYYSTDGTSLKYADYWPTLVDKYFTVGTTHTHSYELKADDDYEWYECSCGAVKDKIAHTYGGWSTSKEPSCTEAGSRWTKCPSCYHVKTETIPPLGHNYSSEVTTQPSCSQEGERTYTCNRCGDSYTEAIEKTEHNYVTDEEVPATCIGAPCIKHICQCGSSYKTYTGLALGHSWNSDGVCTQCGVKKTWVLGDVNCDGKLNVGDVAVLYNCIDHIPYDAFFDIDCNGVIDSNDKDTLYEINKGKITTYEVVLDACGGICDVSAVAVYDGGSYGEIPEPIKEGYTFDGWFTAAEGGEKVEFGDSAQYSDHTLYAHWSQDETYTLGDLNGDGDVTSADSVVLVRFLAGLIELDDEQQLAADINEDGDITSADAVLLTRFLAGIITELKS